MSPKVSLTSPIIFNSDSLCVSVELNLVQDSGGSSFYKIFDSLHSTCLARFEVSLSFDGGSSGEGVKVPY